MNKLRHIFLAAAFMSVLGAGAKDNVDYVDPFIGTTNFSICNPGAIMPHGLMSVVPFNVMGSDLNQDDKDKRWWSAVYEYNNKYFTGFAHVTLSGVGCPEMGTLLTMPTMGELNVDYRSYGSEYKDETARPGYYSTVLTKYGIRTEVTATTRSSIERYTFPKGKGNLLFNLGNGLTNEVGASLRRVSDTEFEGTRMLGTFCYNPQAVFPMYFVVRVNKKPAAYGMWKKQPDFGNAQKQWDEYQGKYKLYPGYGRDMAGNDIGYYMTYDCEEGEQVEVQVGVSFVSIANARENLNKEQKGFNFDTTAKEAHDQWASTLDKVTVEGGTEQQRRVFYTALYHSQIHPTILQDVNGEYPKMESSENGKTSGNRYTVYSLWDTYRNLSQLETLLYPDRQVDMINSMIDMYREWGWMPKWELFSRETWTMEGDPAIPYIADAYMRGLRGFDIETAYKAFRTSATLPGKETACVPTSTRTSARDTYPSDSMLPTCLATIPCRTLWNIISLTTPSLSLLANSDTRATPSCSASARSATATTTQRRAARCVPSTWTARSSLHSILRLAPTSRTVPVSTKVRHGTIRSMCPTM